MMKGQQVLIKMNLAACLLSSLLVVSSVSGGDRPGALAESILRSKGVNTDPASVREAALEAEDVDTRRWAVHLLGMRGDSGALDVVYRAMETDSDAGVRREAAVALSKLEDSRGDEALRELLGQSEDAGEALPLARQLARAGDPSGYRFVLELLESDSSIDLTSGRRALPYFARFENLDALDRLLALTRHEEDEVRMLSTVLVGVAFTEGAPREELFAALRAMVFDSSPQIEERATSSLALLEFLVANEEAEGKQ